MPGTRAAQSTPVRMWSSMSPATSWPLPMDSGRRWIRPVRATRILDTRAGTGLKGQSVNRPASEDRLAGCPDPATGSWPLGQRDRGQRSTGLSSSLAPPRQRTPPVRRSTSRPEQSRQLTSSPLADDGTISAVYYTSPAAARWISVIDITGYFRGCRRSAVTTL